MLRLIEPTEKYIEGYKEAYDLSRKLIDEGKIMHHDSIFTDPYKYNIVQKFKDNLDLNKLPLGYVPAYHFILVDEDKFIGEIHIRTYLTEKLLQYAGHIGYGINPKYWNQGYGKAMLRMALEQYKDLIEDDNILITCDDDNIASSRIIEANGGVLENKVVNIVEGKEVFTRRYWIKK
ncbi:MAG: GNAT family N-acetyltransferase [Bacilli bacterium]|nr:GNAT family N-acetyltransferase [Bacilli bacterium]